MGNLCGIAVLNNSAINFFRVKPKDTTNARELEAWLKSLDEPIAPNDMALITAVQDGNINQYIVMIQGTFFNFTVEDFEANFTVL